jgi:GT2 family glycosyltransferase
MTPRVTAVVLNYNGADDTVACVCSLKQVAYPALDILVVDNGSTDDSVMSIRERIPGLNLVETGKNVGFAGGNNFGIRQALASGSEFLLVINNDTLVEPDFLDPLVDVLLGDPGSAVATGTICYYPEKDTVQYGGGALIGWRASGFSKNVGNPYSTVAHAQVSPVTFASGCLMLVRASDIRELGMFDERFFLYCEDVELCLRFSRAGRRLLYVPQSRIFHRMVHRSERPLPYYFMFRNRLLLVDLLPGRLERLLGKAYLYLSATLKLLLWRMLRPELYRASWMGLEDYARGIFHEGRLAEIAAHSRRAG